MPPAWQERQLSTLNYQQDSSAEGRLTMWEFAIDLAADNPLTGGGFDVFYDPGARIAYLPADVSGKTERGRAAHSIYFEVLGEHGYVGLTLFLLMGLGAFLTAWKIEAHAKDRPDLKWSRDLALMAQISLVAYATSGAFLSMATSDLYYHIIAIIVLTRTIALKQSTEGPEPASGADPFSGFFIQKKNRFRPRRTAGTL
jgi:probable O-glycosylation ligase (exosortase A-associated)